MTPYTYECPEHGEFIATFDFGKAPRETVCPRGDDMGARVYNASIKFTYGKETFHGATVGEQLEAQKKDWADAGMLDKVAPADSNGSRWV